jgi:TrkA domain protein
LTELLGGSQVAESQQELLQTLPGLIIDWVPVREGWSCTGQSIREIGVRARTGASIVAVVRNGETIPSPEADFVMRPGDTAVVVGTVDGIRKTVELLQGTN